MMLDPVNTSVGLAVLGFVWRLSSRLTAVETKVELILTNHLPHIQAAIDRRNIDEE